MLTSGKGINEVQGPHARKGRGGKTHKPPGPVCGCRAGKNENPMPT
jgi:hypothetical protein